MSFLTVHISSKFRETFFDIHLEPMENDVSVTRPIEWFLAYRCRKSVNFAPGDVTCQVHVKRLQELTRSTIIKVLLWSAILVPH